MDTDLFLIGRQMDGDVERGLTGAGKLKILRLLMQKPQHAFTRYEIAKTVPNDPTSIRNDLITLVQVGWVAECQVHRLTKYSINLENPVVRHLFDFLLTIRYIR